MREFQTWHKNQKDPGRRFVALKAKGGVEQLQQSPRTLTTQDRALSYETSSEGGIKAR